MNVSKKRILVILLIVVYFMVYTTSVFSNDINVITLSEAKEMALKNSFEIQQAELDLKKADKARRDADESYEKLKANYFVPAQEPTVTAAREGYRTAQNAYFDQKIIYENKNKQFEYTIEKLFVGILDLDREVEILKKNLEVSLKQIEINRVMLNLGMITQDQVDASVQLYIRDDLVLKGKISMLQSNRMLLNRHLGKNLEGEIYLAEVSLTPILPTQTERETFSSISQTFLNVQQLERTIQEREKDIEWYQYNRSEKVESIRLEIKQMEINYDNVDYSLRLTLKGIYDKIDQSKKALDMASRTYETAKKTYDYDKIKLEHGMITEINFLATDISYQKAYKDFVKAGYDYFLDTRELQLAQDGIFL